MPLENAGPVVRVPIRSIKVVVDTEDPLSPDLTLEEFIRTHGVEPALPRYRVIGIEIVTCPEDQQPILVSECGRYPRFLKRIEDHVYFRKSLTFDR